MSDCYVYSNLRNFLSRVHRYKPKYRSTDISWTHVIKLLSCLRSDIVILDTLIVLLTYLLTYMANYSHHYRLCLRHDLEQCCIHQVENRPTQPQQKLPPAKDVNATTPYIHCPSRQKANVCFFSPLFRVSPYCRWGISSQQYSAFKYLKHGDRLCFSCDDGVQASVEIGGDRSHRRQKRRRRHASLLCTSTRKPVL